jgi:DNA-binding MarR family transcriptional regulator
MSSDGTGQDTNAGVDPIARIEPQLARLARALEAAQKRRVYPLERAHYLLIDVLERAGPQPVGELARRLLLDDSTVTRQLAAMTELGLLRRIANKDDRRVSVVDVTAKARSLAAETRVRRRARIDVLLGGWRADERAQFAALLERFNADFFSLLGEGAAAVR